MLIATGMVSTAHSASVKTLPTTIMDPFPDFLNPNLYQDVPVELANSESIGVGFDMRVGAYVGRFDDYREFDNSEISKNGFEKFAAFRFLNPAIGEGGLNGSGSAARIHEIYFESDLVTILDNRNVAVSDAYMFNGSKLNPNSPSGIDPDWAGTLFGLDEGKGKTGVGEGMSFEIIFPLLVDSITTERLIYDFLSNGGIGARIALHIGDCDIGNSCVIDTWPVMSAVPLPASAILFGTALLGLIVIRRK